MADVRLFGTDEALLPRTRFGTPYEIESLTVRSNRVPRASQTIVNVRVRGSQATDFVTQMVGRSYAGDVSGTTRLRRDLPEKNPHDARQYCTRCEQIDQGGGSSGEGPTRNFVTGWPDPLWVRYRCTFESLMFDTQDDFYVDAFSSTDERELFRYIKRERRVHAKEQQVPGGGFVNSADHTQKLAHTGFKVVSFADVTYTWFRIPVSLIPSTTAGGLVGKVNSASFDVAATSRYNWSAGTLLFTGWDDTDKYWDANGDWVCDLVYSFQYRAIGWNYYLSSTGSPVLVVDAATFTTYPYSSGDFTTLFKI